jgi:hypothetical protein
MYFKDILSISTAIIVGIIFFVVVQQIVDDRPTVTLVDIEIVPGVEVVEDVAIFDIAVTTDDMRVLATDAAYPPPCDGFFSNGPVQIRSGLSSGIYRVFNGLLRWDTSSIPDDATITDATVTYTLNLKQDTGGRNVVGEWYAGTNWPIDCTDHTATVGTTAFNQDLTTVVSPLVLTGVSTVNKTGYTGLRFGISGGAPASQTESIFYMEDSDSGNDLLLTVTYTTENPTETEIITETEVFTGTPLTLALALLIPAVFLLVIVIGAFMGIYGRRG